MVRFVRVKTPQEIHDTLMRDFEIEKNLRVLSGGQYSILDIPKPTLEEVRSLGKPKNFTFTDLEAIRQIGIVGKC